jgi:hypothetical protein
MIKSKPIRRFSMDKLQLRETILKQIERPHIPEREFPACMFGVAADSREVQTRALQLAIDTISREGGGRLTLPRGTIRTGALELKSRVELHLQHRESVLSFVNEEPELHYPVVFSHWEATPCYNYSPLIYACDAHDIAVTGEGTLDGGADSGHWWNWHHQVEDAWSDDKPDLQLEDRRTLRRMNVDGVPVKERVFGPGHYLRPNFIQPIRCSRVLLHGFTLINSPMWQLNPVMCRSLSVDGVTLYSHGANNDGCDPESCHGVHICNCRFDTGDDCISLKSGRDRDGRLASMPCEDVLIENNEFADGHGGIALGSEMSGGIRRVLAVNNRFSSPSLTYALRLKTNARRGGRVEDIILADSVMDHVHGAAVHGTMLYEDGRNGSDLPVFHNITIENIIAHGGDYGIFLEAFDEVPVTGLTLRNIRIDGVTRPMRSMNWKEPVVDDVVINGKCFPRPGGVRILGVPVRGGRVRAQGRTCGGDMDFMYRWQTSADRVSWQQAGEGEDFQVPGTADFIRVTVMDQKGNAETSRVYRVLPQGLSASRWDYEWQRLYCRGMGEGPSSMPADRIITREQLACMLLPLADPALRWEGYDDEDCGDALRIAVGNGFLAPENRTGPEGHVSGAHAEVHAKGHVSGAHAYDHAPRLMPDGHVTRQEMATVAMQACGVNYRNASSTMPVCADAALVNNNYGTNVARALYFGFMSLEPDGCFKPRRPVTIGEAAGILNRVADFAGI